MRAWLVPAAVSLLVLSGCADVDTDDASPAAASPTAAAVPCTPAPDQLAFAITYRLKWPTAKLARPFVVEKDGQLLLAADATTLKGEPRAKGAVWVSSDRNGTKIASLNDEAKAHSDFPDAAGTFDVSPTDPAVARVRECVVSG